MSLDSWALLTLSFVSATAPRFSASAANSTLELVCELSESVSPSLCDISKLPEIKASRVTGVRSGGSSALGREGNLD